MPIRAATPDDARAIAALEAVAAGSPWTAGALEAVLGHERMLALVAEDDGTLVAHLLGTAITDEGEILSIAVHPDHRRRGLGRALLDAAHAAWADRGVTTAWLEVRTDNDGARALYAAAGWTEAGRRPAYYTDGTDAVVMQRALSRP